MINYDDWEILEQLPLASETPIRKVLPRENVFQDDLLVSRSAIMTVPRTQWEQIHDAALPDAYAKATSVESYFCVCVYVVRRSGMLSIAAQQSVDKTETIEHTSSFRQSITDTQRLDVTLDASAFSKSGSLMAHVGTTYELSTVTEYATESRRTSTVEIRYEPAESDRDVVFWDVAKVVVLFRKLNAGFSAKPVQLVGVGDFYAETYQKTYVYSEENGKRKVIDCSEVKEIHAQDDVAMTLRMTGALNATITGTITYRPNVLGWPHCFICSNMTALAGISRNVTYDRRGVVRAVGAGRNITGNELRIRWTNGTCNVYVR